VVAVVAVVPQLQTAVELVVQVVAVRAMIQLAVV
jgi:hypothetical protein